MKPTALVRRLGAMGDVVNTTPVVRRLAREGYAVYVQTHHGEVYNGNPDLALLDNSVASFDRTIDLMGAYEARRDVHHIRAYMQVAFGDGGDGHDLTGFVAHDPRFSAAHYDISASIVVHPTRSWPNRTLPQIWWEDLVVRLCNAGFPVVLTGSLHDHTVHEPRAFDLRGRLTLSQQLSLIESARCFVGGESGLATAAGATEAPIVNLYALTRGELWLPFRHNVMGWNFHSITPQIECFGCAARQGAVEYFDCERGTRECLQLFDPAYVVQVVERAISNDRRRAQDS
jgi:ADP-heptose:LPS heptosyltransferase